MDWNVVLALATGVGLAAACGLRAFLPVLAVGLAAHFGLLHLRPELAWLSQPAALWALGTAAALELIGDKVPVLDHALDTLGMFLRPAAAWVGSYAILQGWGAPWAQLFALAMGAGALAVHGAKAGTRVGSTATTLGAANPVLSVIEDVVSFALVALAVLVPLLALALVALLFVAMLRLFRRRHRTA
jgi:hypothetical protein